MPDFSLLLAGPIMKWVSITDVNATIKCGSRCAEKSLIMIQAAILEWAKNRVGAGQEQSMSRARAGQKQGRSRSKQGRSRAKQSRKRAGAGQ